jgi:hypothetical protein
MWAYRGVNIKLNVFDFTVSRHRDGPELFFADYEGTLLGDCWHGCEAITVASQGRILRAACNVHYPECGFIWMDSDKQWAGSYLERYRKMKTPDNCSPQRESRNARSVGDGRQRAAARRSSPARFQNA